MKYKSKFHKDIQLPDIRERAIYTDRTERSKAIAIIVDNTIEQAENLELATKWFDFYITKLIGKSYWRNAIGKDLIVGFDVQILDDVYVKFSKSVGINGRSAYFTNGTDFLELKSSIEIVEGFPKTVFRVNWSDEKQANIMAALFVMAIL